MATALICGAYQGHTDLCINQADTWVFSTRDKCLVRAQELIQQGRTAFRYVRVPEPWRTQIRCVKKTGKANSISKESPPQAEEKHWWQWKWGTK